MKQLRLRFSTECRHCGVKTDMFWLWEHEIKDEYICGNCQYKAVVLKKVLERVEIDPLKPFEER